MEYIFSNQIMIFLFLKIVHKIFNWIVSIKSFCYLHFVNIFKVFYLDQYFLYIVNCILCNFKVHNNTSNCQHKSSEQIHGFRNTWDVCYQGWLKKIDVYCLQSVSWECGKGAWERLIWRLSMCRGVARMRQTGCGRKETSSSASIWTIKKSVVSIAPHD